MLFSLDMPAPEWWRRALLWLAGRLEAVAAWLRGLAG